MSLDFFIGLVHCTVDGIDVFDFGLLCQDNGPAFTVTRIDGNSSLRRQRRGCMGRSGAAEIQSCREDLEEKIHFSARRIHLVRVTGR